jgi:hypothetical protein
LIIFDYSTSQIFNPVCTVTFIPKSDTSFILTSNRDEAPGRDTIVPAVYEIGGVQCLFPKDAVAGGTWIGVSNKKRLVSLLNGGFEAHTRAGAYRMSRGVVVKDLLVADSLAVAVGAYDFNGIEPFTLIAVEHGDALQLFELVWDGAKAHFTEKPLEPTIWSSSLLYTQEMKQKREVWFSHYLKSEHISEGTLLDFHKTAGEGNAQIDLIMDRGFVKTKAITQIIGATTKVKMRYEDLQTQNISEGTLAS